MADDREQKNVVFGGQQANSPIQVVDRVKAELGLDIPVESVPLPSMGKVYPEGSPLCGKETIEISGMTTREEDILTSRALIKKGTVVSDLMRSCVIDKSINVNDLIAGDRNALMVAIRITGYGPEYNAEIQCGGCDKKTTREFRLDQMSLKRLEIEPVSPGQNLFPFTLPSSKIEVQFKFLTGKDEEEMLLIQERMKKVTSSNDQLITTRLKHSIVAMNGKNDKALISQAIPRLRSNDSKALRLYIEKNEPGIDMSQDTTCDDCGHTESVVVPLQVGFFWPST